MLIHCDTLLNIMIHINITQELMFILRELKIQEN